MLKKVRDADIHLLRVFVAVAECGGIAAAQDRLNVAASTISTQISNLETRLGFRLCDRGRAGFSLTSEGEIVLQSTYELLRDMGRFINSLEAVKEDLVGTIHIIVMDNILKNKELKLTRAFRQLRHDFPLLQFDIRQLPPGHLESAILKRQADLAIAWVPSVPPSLSITTLVHEEQIICCGRGHPLFDRAPDEVSAQDLEAADWVQRGYHLPQSVPFSRPPVSTVVSDYMEGIAHFVLAGTHIAYLPRHYAMQWFDSADMRPLLPDEFGIEQPISLVARIDLNNDNRVAAVKNSILMAHTEQPERVTSDD